VLEPAPQTWKRDVLAKRIELDDLDTSQHQLSAVRANNPTWSDTRVPSACREGSGQNIFRRSHSRRHAFSCWTCWLIPLQ
jgi:hypothetical protein